ncbi:unnamed protein product [Amoebophrya sp. A120]|nr:unnamed protein product [Amoebophrya sp. A120]|eukprot:GSA120T00015086001.1
MKSYTYLLVAQWSVFQLATARQRMLRREPRPLPVSEEVVSPSSQALGHQEPDEQGAKDDSSTTFLALGEDEEQHGGARAKPKATKRKNENRDERGGTTTTSPDHGAAQRVNQGDNYGDKVNYDLDAMDNEGCSNLNKLHVRESRLRYNEDPLSYQIRQLGTMLSRAERITDTDSTAFREAYTAALQQRDCLFWLIDEAKGEPELASHKAIDHAVEVSALARAGDISALEKRYRTLFSGEEKPRHLKSDVSTSDVLRNKVRSGEFEDKFDNYLAMHIVQENDNARPGEKTLLSEGTAHNSAGESMVDVVEKAGAWFGKQERVAKRLRDDYSQMQNHLEAAAVSLPADIEANPPEYPDGIVNGAKALKNLRSVVPSFIRHTKDKLMKIFEQV